jgi:antitoxin (DNA-binding transcriptional repressor) of toxin-antitoxin stability system
MYNAWVSNNVIHISKAEAASNFASLLDRVRAGAEVIIEEDSNPVAVLRSAPPRAGRLLSESIALAEAHAQELGYTPTLDPDFAADLQEIINSHRAPFVSGAPGL